MSEDGFYPLYGGTPPFESGSETSLAAAERARATASGRRLRVLKHIAARGALGATDDELERVLGFPHQTASARRRELVLMGLVKDSGGTRKTQHGGDATIWTLGLGDMTPGGGAGNEPLVPTAASMRRALAALYKLCGGKPKDLNRPDVPWLQDLVELCAWVEAVADVLDPEVAEPVDTSRVCWGEDFEPDVEDEP